MLPLPADRSSLFYRSVIALEKVLNRIQRLWSYDLMALYKSVYYYYYYYYYYPSLLP